MDYLLYGLYLLYLGTAPEVGTVGVWHLQNRASRWVWELCGQRRRHPDGHRATPKKTSKDGHAPVTTVGYDETIHAPGAKTNVRERGRASHAPISAAALQCCLFWWLPCRITTLFPTGDLISVLGLVSTMLQPKVLPTLAPREKLSWKEKLTILVWPKLASKGLRGYMSLIIDETDTAWRLARAYRRV